MPRILSEETKQKNKERLKLWEKKNASYRQAKARAKRKLELESLKQRIKDLENKLSQN